MAAANLGLVPAPSIAAGSIVGMTPSTRSGE